MRKAIIDIGTNIFNLLIADTDGKTFQRIYHTKRGVGFGINGINQHRLAADAQERAMEALRHFKSECDRFQVDEIIAIGTSALRTADNRHEFIQRVQSELSFSIQLITGDQEAKWIYQGVKQTFEITEKTLIVDIGGGSIEFILADSKGIQKEVSLPIGISRMFQAIPTSNPLNNMDKAHIRQWTEANIGKQLDDMNCTILVGASGSFETFYEMIEGKKFTGATKSYLFNPERLNESLNTLISSKRIENISSDGKIPIREMMGPMTCVFIQWMLKRFGVKSVWVSPYSVKEGIILDTRN